MILRKINGGKQMEKNQKNKGITLIALVVTIVILLILAGISISMLTGQNSILNRAKEAKEKNLKSQKEEQSVLNNYEEKISNYVGVDWEYAKSSAKAPEEQKEKRNNNVIGLGTDGKPVNMDLWEYTLLEDNTYGLNSNEVFNNKEIGGTNEENISRMGYKGGFSNGKIIGKVPQYISTDNGKSYKAVTNMYITFINCNDLEEAPEIPETVNNLMGTFVGNGNLLKIGKIPDYVVNMTSTFYECKKLLYIENLPNKGLTSMPYTFFSCEDLEKVPYIPDTVQEMGDTFRKCYKLTELTNLPSSLVNMKKTFEECNSLASVPNIPSNVIDMTQTFYKCTNLLTISEIPNKVENMNDTFKYCINLKSCPPIPESVTNMLATFSYCANLQGEIEINANLDGKIVLNNYRDYDDCLMGATTLSGISLKVTGSCKKIDEIVATANNENVTRK